MPKKTLLMMMLGLLLSLSGCGRENSQDASSEARGQSYFMKGEYKKAVPLLRKSAAAGNASAQYYLGVMHRDGKGLEKSTSKACEYFRKAAEGGHDSAYLPASQCFTGENGLEKNDRESFKWASKAAKNGSLNTEDQKTLAAILAERYFSGKGTQQDFGKAAEWLEKAASLGDRSSQAMLAFQYLSGKGVLIDRERARHWAQMAAEHPGEMKEYAMAVLCLLKDPADTKKAVYWYEHAARKGNSLAQLSLAMLYEKGEGVKQNLARAHQYYRDAAKEGNEFMTKALEKFESEHGFRHQ